MDNLGKTYQIPFKEGEIVGAGSKEGKCFSQLQRGKHFPNISNRHVPCHLEGRGRSWLLGFLSEGEAFVPGIVWIFVRR
jgi:hypothetical protein